MFTLFLFLLSLFFFFFFNDTATTEIYTLSLHDALPICRGRVEYEYERRDTVNLFIWCEPFRGRRHVRVTAERDRKSTRLNSSHDQISYAVFCLKKKKKIKKQRRRVLRQNQT